MAHPTPAQCAEALGRNRALPLFTTGSVDVGRRILSLLHAAGFGVVEYTNRAPGSVAVFAELAKAAAGLDGLLLGAGTIVDLAEAEAYHAAGAGFIVSPVLDETVGHWCGRHGIPWCPGTATPTEMVRADRLGAAVIKVFPADTLGGADYLRAVRGPLAGLRLMPSGGVTLDEPSLSAWFAAGAHCVGIGSHLIDTRLAEAGRFDELARRAEGLSRSLRAIPGAGRSSPGGPP
jgi:2-dehydro-3-deoxyphosphogluconate aldolase/(4S)-4-hydroxy-2-oxoglutarate aldolase